MDSLESLNTTRTIDEIFADIEEAQPKLIQLSVPANMDEQKQKFLNGEIINPLFVYDKIDAFDTDGVRNCLISLRDELTTNPKVNIKHLPAYLAFIERNIKIIDLLDCARAYNHADSDDDKQSYAAEYKLYNAELYGEPDNDTYKAMLFEKVDKLDSKVFTGTAERTYKELLDLLPERSGTVERFVPKEETVQYASDLAQFMYGSMLEHIDEGIGSYTPEMIRDTFKKIIFDEFGDAAIGWQVVLEKATSINVVPAQNKIVIPIDRAPVSISKIRGLVAHELGVHFLRALMGSQTDFKLLKIGFSNNNDAEEGLGRVMEQAVVQRYEESGVNYYIITGLLQSGLDFRTVHEIMWRLEALGKAKDSDITDVDITNKQAAMFKSVFRATRLTNGLYWSKDLCYYNGSISQWKFIEQNMGDYEKLATLFYGKIDQNNTEHERHAYEARSIDW